MERPHSPEQLDRPYGDQETDEVHSSELTSDPDEGPGDPGQGPGIAWER